LVTPLATIYYDKSWSIIFFVNLAGNCFSKSLLNDLLSLTTTDKTEPKFVFEKVRDCRLLYDVFKKAGLEADKQNHVIHLE
jgi:hypothetical protein